MTRLEPLRLARCAALALGFAAATAHAAIAIVAAESVYGELARQIGGGYVSVASILASADQDPHDFEAAAGVARRVSAARVVIYNGAGYDPWLERLLSAAPSGTRDAIEVAKLAGRASGDNPHLWYDVSAMERLAAALAAKLAEIDPEHRQAYADGQRAFAASLAPLRAKIAALRARYAGTPVTATEPLFDYMADALGLAMRNSRFQLAVMNGTEPGARTIAAFEHDLRSRAVKVLLYNAQTGAAIAQRMRAIADAAGVPVVTITETQPAGKTYPQWMLSQLDALGRALSGR